MTDLMSDFNPDAHRAFWLEEIAKQTLPDSQNMVTQPRDIRSDDILCVRCGWEGVSRLPQAPWPVFRNHTCEEP